MESDLLEEARGHPELTGAVGDRPRSVRSKETRGSGRGQEIRWWPKLDKEEENLLQAGTMVTGSDGSSFIKADKVWTRSGDKEVVV